MYLQHNLLLTDACILKSMNGIHDVTQCVSIGINNPPKCTSHTMMHDKKACTFKNFFTWFRKNPLVLCMMMSETVKKCIHFS